jgi:uncharacterized protein YgiM (DUF1202 family)
MLKRALMCVLIALIVSSCSKSTGSTPPPPMPTDTPIIETLSPLPAVLPSLTIVTPTASLSPTPFTSFTVKPSVDLLKVRMNPGFAFESLIMVQTADELTVMGTAPGNEWTYVKTPSGTEGWVFTQMLQSSVDLTKIPVKEPANLVVIKGRVTDANGAPIQGVGFDVLQGTDSQGASNSVVTDGNGVFYLFLPNSSSGIWTISYNSIACTSIVWTDSTCTTYKTGYTGSIDPTSQTVTLPQGNNMLTFTWK